MRNIILAVIVTAGLTIPFSFIAGSIFYKKQLNCFKQKNADLEARNQELIISAKDVQAVGEELKNRFLLLISANKKMTEQKDYYMQLYKAACNEIEDTQKSTIQISNGSEENSYTCDDFYFTNFTIKGGGSETYVKGIIQNASFTDYDSVSFEISFFDKNGIVLGVGQLYITSFKAGQKRAFQDQFYDIPRRDIAGFKIDISSKYRSG